MHTILHCAPNITDLYLTLYIWRSNSGRGLACGLPDINPRRVIVFDVDKCPKKNTQVALLFDTLQSFELPYIVEDGMNRTCADRTKTPLSALGRACTLETLIMRNGFLASVPDELLQLCHAPSLKSLQFIRQEIRPPSSMTGLLIADDALHALINNDPRLKAIVEFKE
ncbi:hypothetical protein DFH06DRAFT_1343568 [Mycena polygramma]|nr:hypothetical protein DFH06DRAFT_1343568 [Mycena polygramma]